MLVAKPDEMDQGKGIRCTMKRKLLNVEGPEDIRRFYTRYDKFDDNGANDDRGDCNNKSVADKQQFRKKVWYVDLTEPLSSEKKEGPETSVATSRGPFNVEGPEDIHRFYTRYDKEVADAQYNKTAICIDVTETMSSENGTFPELRSDDAGIGSRGPIISDLSLPRSSQNDVSADKKCYS